MKAQLANLAQVNEQFQKQAEYYARVGQQARKQVAELKNKYLQDVYQITKCDQANSIIV